MSMSPAKGLAVMKMLRYTGITCHITIKDLHYSLPLQVVLSVGSTSPMVSSLLLVSITRGFFFGWG